MTSRARHTSRLWQTVVMLALVAGACGETPLEPVSVSPVAGLQGFEAALDSIRVELQIPGLAAAIAQDGDIIWSRGFGMADVERGIPATDTTAFYLASVTKSIGAIVLMQLVEEGLVDLDDPISEYGVNLEADGVIGVKHVFNHTSEGTPGTVFRYNGSRYSKLGDVILRASGRSFAQLLAERILRPLGLRHTAPDVQILPDFYVAGLDRQEFLANVAMPYELRSGLVVPSGRLRHFSPAAGLVSSARDVAAISIALGADQFLDPTTKETMLSPSIEINGSERTYGLGWYVQTYNGVKLEWHYGLAIGHSSLLVRAPQQGLTFVALANTSRLTGAYDMAAADIMETGPGRLFVESFVLGQNSR
ncbi:MAG: serine hydrolase [Gemmatimonadales bacterium]|jgi:CubicO group peptidase (beta-lactamase class C family)